MIMCDTISQLVELWLPYFTQIGQYGTTKVSVRLGMFLADTPQRNETCDMKNHNADIFCHQCVTNKRVCLDLQQKSAESNVPGDDFGLRF